MLPDCLGSALGSAILGAQRRRPCPLRAPACRRRPSVRGLLSRPRYGFVGAYEPNISTEQIEYRVSLITGAVIGLASLVRLQLLDALDRIVTGAESAIRFGAGTVSAVDNAVINPLLQATRGNGRIAALGGHHR